MATRIPIHLLSARPARLSTSTTEAREERVQAQEVGVIRSVRLSQGEIWSGRLRTGEHYRDRRDTVQWCYRVNQWRGL